MSARNEGHATIAGGTVYYLYAAPTDTAALKSELQVLQAFLAAWNANMGDNPAEDIGGKRTTTQLPSATRAAPPATKLVITSANHKSHQSSAMQAKHLTVHVCTDANWALTPPENGAVVHVFANGEDPAQGYKDYLMYSTRRQKFSSATIQAQLALAEATDFGTLGQGTLA